MHYGPTYKDRLMDDDTADRLLQEALTLGINHFDTAALYGVAQQRLGRAVRNLPPDTRNQLSVTTKVAVTDRIESSVSKTTMYSKTIADINRSLEIIGETAIKKILLHQSSKLEHANQKIQLIKYIKSQYPQMKIGLAIYDPSEVMCSNILDHCEVLQIPINLADPRWCDSEMDQVLSQFSKSGGIIQARSIFLQGKFLTNQNIINDLGAEHTGVKIILNTLQNLSCPDLGQLSINYVISNNWLGELIFGVDNSLQLKSNVAMINQAEVINLMDFKNLKNNTQNFEEQTYDPRMWQ